MAQAGDRSGRWRRSAVAGFLFVFAAAAVQGQLELVSRVDPSQISETGAGAESSGNDPVFFQSLPGPSVSSDGRYVVFLSTAVNLVSGQRDMNATGEDRGRDVFLRDLLTGTTTLVSRSMSSPSTTGNQESLEAILSLNGRYVVFTTRATDLAPGQASHHRPENYMDLLLYDRVTGALEVVAQSSIYDAHFGDLSLSADGRHLAFSANAQDLLPGQTEGFHGGYVVLYDRVEKTARLVSRKNNSPSTSEPESAGTPEISADGRYITFLGRGSNESGQSVEFTFLYDRLAHAFVRIGTGFPVMSSDGRYIALFDGTVSLYDRETRQTTLITERGDFGRWGPPIALSGDGRFLAFVSNAWDLVPGQTPAESGLFLYDRVSRTVSLVSRRHDSPTTPGKETGAPSISADGRYIAFLSLDPDMVSGQIDTERSWDVFLFDRLSGKTTLVSHASSSPSATGDSFSMAPVISTNGASVVFSSLAGNLVEDLADFNQGHDVFVYPTASGNTTALSLRAPEMPSLSPGADSAAHSLSADGRFVAFESHSAHLISGQVDTNLTGDVFLYDRTTRTTLLVSRSAVSTTRTGNGGSFRPVISADGRYVTFGSLATDLVSGVDDSNEGSDVFLFDRMTGTTTLVSRSAESGSSADGDSSPGRISRDGRFLAFTSNAIDLVPGQGEDSHGTLDVFLYDRTTGGTIFVSRSSAGFADSGEPALSTDGRYVVFRSREDLFFYDRTTGKTTLISHAWQNPETPAGVYHQAFSISDDGRFVVFSSLSQDLDPSAGDSPFGIYLYDRARGSNKRIAPTLSQGGPKISADGRFVVFASDQELVPGIYWESGLQIYLYDRVSGTLTHVTRSILSNGGASHGEALSPEISADGRYIAFTSNAADLVPGQVVVPESGRRDLYLFDRVSGKTTLVSRPMNPSRPELGQSATPLLTPSGRHLAFTSSAPDLVPGDLNLRSDAFLFTRPNDPVSVPACTLFDSRRRQDRPILRSGVRRVVKAHGACSVPARAKSVVVKVTAVNPTGKGNVRLYPGDSTTASAGILRFERGKTRSGVFTIPLAANGTGTFAILPQVAGNGTLHLSVEVSGYIE